MLQSSPTPLHARVNLHRYGHSAREEIAKRIADAKARFSLDTTTTPATVAGGIVGGTGNRKK